MTALQIFFEIKWKPFYFQSSQISDIWFIENTQYEQKFDLPTKNSICEKAWFTIKLFFNLAFFYFPKFQMAIVKNHMKLSSLFMMDFRGSYEVLLPHKYFRSTYF